MTILWTYGKAVALVAFIGVYQPANSATLSDCSRKPVARDAVWEIECGVPEIPETRSQAGDPGGACSAVIPGAMRGPPPSDEVRKWSFGDACFFNFPGGHDAERQRYGNQCRSLGNKFLEFVPDYGSNKNVCIFKIDNNTQSNIDTLTIVRPEKRNGIPPLAAAQRPSDDELAAYQQMKLNIKSNLNSASNEINRGNYKKALDFILAGVDESHSKIDTRSDPEYLPLKIKQECMEMIARAFDEAQNPRISDSTSDVRHTAPSPIGVCNDNKDDIVISDLLKNYEKYKQYQDKKTQYLKSKDHKNDKDAGEVSPSGCAELRVKLPKTKISPYRGKILNDCPYAITATVRACVPGYFEGVNKSVCKNEEYYAPPQDSHFGDIESFGSPPQLIGLRAGR